MTLNQNVTSHKELNLNNNHEGFGFIQDQSKNIKHGLSYEEDYYSRQRSNNPDENYNQEDFKVFSIGNTFILIALGLMLWSYLRQFNFYF